MDLGSDSVLALDLSGVSHLPASFECGRCVYGVWVVQGLWQCVYGFDFSFDLICHARAEGRTLASRLTVNFYHAHQKQ